MSGNRSHFTPSVVPFSFTTSNMVPDSCIESAEYIIQCFHRRQILNWEKGQIKDPQVYAHFANDKLNITKDAIMKKDLTNFSSWKFTKLPESGQGICLINKTNKDNPSNMHFMAVINPRQSPRGLSSS